MEQLNQIEEKIWNLSATTEDITYLLYLNKQSEPFPSPRILFLLGLYFYLGVGVPLDKDTAEAYFAKSRKLLDRFIKVALRG